MRKIFKNDSSHPAIRAVSGLLPEGEAGRGFSCN